MSLRATYGRTLRAGVASLVVLTLLAGCGSPLGDDDEEQVTLRVGTQMTTAELASFEAGLAEIKEEHPEWNIVLEQTPQDAFPEKFNTQIASNTLPDIIQLGIQHAQQGISQGVLLDLTDLIEDEDFNTDDYWPGSMEGYLRDGKPYGIPLSASPNVLFYNKAMFDAAGVAYPTDDWTFDDLKAAAIQLTLDGSGANASDPAFDPDNVVQWGLNAAPAHLYSAAYLRPFGGDPCVNPACTEMSFSAPPVQEAMAWWVDLVANSHAAPYDPYSGNQTGVPGDPFVAGLAAMGFSGYFLVGQLNATGTIDYDIVQSPMGPAGIRSTEFSVQGFGIAANSEHPEEAFELLQVLTSSEFTSEYWAKPGHGVPAAKSGAEAVLNPDAAPDNEQAIIDSMEFGAAFKPFSEGGFESYIKTVDIFVSVYKGETPLAEGMAQVDAIIAETLVREPSGP
jgi:multiple sugar transport system substrate-binding protein